MVVFSHPEFRDHEEVRFLYDARSGLRAIIAVHSTLLGPALGGCRMWPYASEAEALADALRLSRAMTLKAAMAGLRLGGGKSVILGDPKRDKSPELLRAFGREVERMGGRYYTGEDVGTSPEDMAVAGEVTRFVLGKPGTGSSGDPSPFTARGVLAGIAVALRHRLGREELCGVKVAVQGLGHVGMALCALLHERGARLWVADLDPIKVADARRRFGAEAVPPERVHALDVDVFSPCALGGVLNAKTVPELGCRLVAGSANNQLASPEDGRRLHERGILYAPDYVINAGGLINIAQELHPDGYDRARALAALEVIPRRLHSVFRRAEAEGRPPAEVADAMAAEMLEAAARSRAA